MKIIRFAFFISIFTVIQCGSPEQQVSEFASVSRVETGKPVSVMLTSYSTTLIADGLASTRLRIAVTDSLGREITSAADSLFVYVTGQGTVTHPDGSPLDTAMDTTGLTYGRTKLEGGLCNLVFVAGNEPDRVKVEVRSGKLWPGAHEIHTVPSGIILLSPKPDQLSPTTKPIARMIGADISWLPELEAKGRKFFENGQEVDAIDLLRRHGFNFIRLRIFVNPENENGYSPGEGFCGLSHTLAMAKRVKESGMNLLLDFHYSDYWADPQQQFKPMAWNDLDFSALQDTLRAYTSDVLLALKEQGTLPAMVQIGNEINHGMLWPDGHIGNPDQLAALLRAGVEAVEAVDPALPVMMHIALGGQNEEAVFWLDNMIARGVQFDIIGLSYYPRWHGTLDDLQGNMLDLVKRYNKPVNVVEYSDFKKEVHDIAFGLPGDLGKGACIWEPFSWMSPIVDREGNVNPLIGVYDALAKKYIN